MIVYKIGGAVLKEASNFLHINSLLHSNSYKKILIVSAIGKTTRLLEEVAHFAINGDLPSSLHLIEQIYLSHIAITQNWGKKFQNFFQIEKKFKKISLEAETLVRGIAITNELSTRTRDLLLSKGEDFSLALVEYYLESSKISFDVFDAKSYLFTDSNFGSANPILEQTEIEFSRLLAISTKDVILTQGFVGRAMNGEITTMGFESSNLTASILAKITKAKELFIITDVNGIYSADPNSVTKPQLCSSLSLRTAVLAAQSGLKLIYPGMIKILENQDIDIHFGSVNQSGATLLSKSSTDPDFPLIISNLEEQSINVTLVNLNYDGFIKLTNFLDAWYGRIDSISLHLTDNICKIKCSKDIDLSQITNGLNELFL